MATILITGANRGIGLGFVEEYLHRGETVHATARDPNHADDLQRLSGDAGGQLTIHPLDVTDPKSVTALAERLDGVALDLLINNAGVYPKPDPATVQDIGRDWTATLVANVVGPMMMAAAFKPHLKAAAPGAKLVTISSEMGSISRSPANSAHYRASKAAVNMAMHCLGLDWADDGIWTLAQIPGWVQTDMGGDAAPFTVKDSVAAMVETIARLNAETSGAFLQPDGQICAY